MVDLAAYTILLLTCWGTVSSDVTCKIRIIKRPLLTIFLICVLLTIFLICVVFTWDNSSRKIIYILLYAQLKLEVLNSRGIGVACISPCQ
ncbi:hypothetical protein O6H91_Y138500 [Diphasiastrum complanatum]|nr:hypothetical protein O6H91_Y138500 [Diphasiastrum complanatum]